MVPGFPIRTSLAQMLVTSSPTLFASYYVLHRLWLPRHPPYTLGRLTIQPGWVFIGLYCNQLRFTCLTSGLRKWTRLEEFPKHLIEVFENSICMHQIHSEERFWCLLSAFQIVKELIDLPGSTACSMNKQSVWTLKRYTDVPNVENAGAISDQAPIIA